MTEDEKKQWAKAIIQECNDNYEYSLVYEQEDLEDEDESTWEDILDLMYAAKIDISWKD